MRFVICTYTTDRFFVKENCEKFAEKQEKLKKVEKYLKKGVDISKYPWYYSEAVARENSSTTKRIQEILK